MSPKNLNIDAIISRLEERANSSAKLEIDDIRILNGTLHYKNINAVASDLEITPDNIRSGISTLQKKLHDQNFYHHPEVIELIYQGIASSEDKRDHTDAAYSGFRRLAADEMEIDWDKIEAMRQKTVVAAPSGPQGVSELANGHSYTHLSNEQIVAAIQQLVVQHKLDIGLFTDGHAPGQKEKLRQAIRDFTDDPDKAQTIIDTCDMPQMRGYLLLGLPETRELYGALLEKNKGIITNFYNSAEKIGYKVGLTTNDMKNEFSIYLLGTLLNFNPQKSKFTAFLEWQLRANKHVMFKEHISRTHTMHQASPLSSSDDDGHQIWEERVTSREFNPLERIIYSEDLQRLVEGRQSALNALDDREKQVFQLHSNDGLALKEVGEMLGVSIWRVRQIENDALRKMAAVLKPLGIDPANLFAKKAKRAKTDASYLTDDFILEDHHITDTVRKHLYHAIMRNIHSKSENSQIFDRFIFAGIIAGRSDKEIAQRVNMSPVREYNMSVNNIKARRNKLEIDLGKSGFVDNSHDLIERIKHDDETPDRLTRFIHQLECRAEGKPIPKSLHKKFKVGKASQKDHAVAMEASDSNTFPITSGIVERLEPVRFSTQPHIAATRRRDTKSELTGLLDRADSLIEGRDTHESAFKR
jgi:RNA polymerase sigma factor (sigma-70 family)